jgi:hypothetical protein
VIEEFLQASNGRYVRVVKLNDAFTIYILPDFTWYPSLMKQSIMYVGDGSTIILDGKYVVNLKREKETHNSL